MCKELTDEGCVLAEQQKELKAKVEGMDVRLTKVEEDVGKVRSETQEGFKSGAAAMREISASVANLAHDFGQRMNNLDTRIVSEKEKWGETLRDILRWTARVILAGAAVAMGITVWNNLVK